MKKYLYLLSTLLLLLGGGGNVAWAQGQANETYDLTSSGDFTYGASYSPISGGKYWEKIGNTPIYGRFASSTNSSRGWFFNSGSLRCWGGRYTPDLAICNLHKGDWVVITFTGFLNFVSGSAKHNNVALSANDEISSGQAIIATSDGDIIVKGNGENAQNYTPIDFTFISKIEVFYRSAETYTFTGNEGDPATPTAANSDIVPGASDYEPVTIDGEKGYILDFTDKTYGNCNFNHPENRFFIKEEGWKVNNNGLQIDPTDNTGMYYAFYILNLNASDEVVINLNNPENKEGDLAKFWSTNTGNASLDKLTSGTKYTMQSGGILKLLIQKKVAVASVVITPSPIRFTKLTDTYNLVNLNYTEPTLIVPSGATNISYNSLNEKIAKINPNGTNGDLMIINTGTVTIQASATIGENTYTTAYELTVMAAEAIWDVRNGNECYFPNSNPQNPSSNNNTGKLLVRKVTSVPHMTMEFGDASNENLTMVTLRHDKRAANLIDQNGWQHIWMNHITSPGYLLQPHQGTFYKFQPTISGDLTIYGIRNHNGSGANTVVLVDVNGNSSGNWNDSVNSGRRTSIIDNNVTYYSYPIVQTISFANDDAYEATGTAVRLTGGHTYYLYANTPATRSESLSGDWQCFYLTGFKYETTFKFPYQNVVMGNSGAVTASGYHHIPAANTYTQTINNAGQQNNITYSRICKGNISADIDTNTGQLSNINGHGAIVVTATLTEVGIENKTSYVLTVPYTTIENGGSKHWVFNMANYDYNGGNPTGDNMMEQLAQLTTNAPAEEWTIKYKVRQYNATTKALEYINVPVLANALDVVGDNARYIGTTEGLLFNARANTFGTTTGVNEETYRIHGSIVEKKINEVWTQLTDASDIDIALKTLLSYNANDAAGTCYYLTLENGNSMTIPNLKAGQHIRIKWSRYAKNQGDNVTVHNVTDLNGTTMDGQSISVGAGGNVDRNGGTGYHEFIVKDNGDVTFTVAQNGWVNIYEIMVDNNFIPTDLKLADGESLIRKKESGNSFSHVYSHKWSDILCQSNVSVSYSIKNDTRTGTLTPENCDVTTTGSGDDFHYYLNVGESGHGRFTLVQEGKVGDYVLDRKEIEIKVYEYDYTPQVYPRTWNMENISKATGTALSTESGWTNANGNYRNWTSAGENKYQLTLEPENLISWSTKAAVDGSQTTINELNGLGIRPADITRRNNSIVFNNADHSIDITGDATQILTVPNVTNDHYAYIRVKKGTDASVTAKFTANTTTADKELTTVYDDGTYAVYKAKGGGKTTDGNAHIIDFYLKNVSVIQVAVSKDIKTISAAGYATEARDYPVDYTMTKTLTGNDYIAYKITGVSDNKVIATHVEYVPAGAGVMITGNVTELTTRPIFTTDVNRTNDLSSMEGNKLIGVIDNSSMDNVWETSVENSITYYNYMLAKSGYNVIRQNGIPTAGTQINGLGFYLAYAQGTVINGNTYQGGKPKNNSAYLKLTEALAVHQGLDDGNGNSAPAPKACFFINFNDDDETTAIENIPVIRGQKDVYYTLQGVRVTTPAKGNVYILNGKKIFIK